MSDDGEGARRGARGPTEGSGAGERPQAVGSVIRDALGQGRMVRGVSLGRLVRSWPEVVGDRLARESAPLSLDEGGLLVGVSTAAWAAQLRFLADDVRRRANDVLGREAVTAVRVVVRGSEPRKALRRNGFRTPPSLPNRGREGGHR